MAGGFRYYGILTLVVFTVLLLLLSGSLQILFLIGIPLMFGLSTLLVYRRMRPERPPVPAPIGPLLEPAQLEGRVDRMTVEDVEIRPEETPPWRKPRVYSVFVIMISGIRYTLDPAPIRRGGYDWIHAGLWVEAEFDRQTRVIYEIHPGRDPGTRR